MSKIYDALMRAQEAFKSRQPEVRPNAAVSITSSEKRESISRGILSSQITLINILQLCTLQKMSGVLKLSRGKEVVQIFLVNGDIVHATCPMGEGEKALFYPLTWGDVTFVLLGGAAPSQTITRPSKELLDELITVSQEWELIREVIPTEKLVFRIVESDNTRDKPITILPEGWRILRKIDGFRHVRGIAEVLRLPYINVAKVIYSLHRSGLVEVVPVARKSSPGPVSPGIFVGTIVLMGILIIGSVYYLTGHALREQVEKRAFAIATNLSDVAAGHVVRKNALELHALVTKYARLEGMAYTFIEDGQGKIVAQSLGSFPPGPRQPLTFDERRQAGQRALTFEGKTVYETHMPILEGQMGTAHVGIWADFVKQQVYHALLPIIGVVTIALLAGAILSIFLVRGVSLRTAG
jgi:hypothetical protein